MNKKYLRSEKIKEINDNKIQDIHWVELEENILATTYIPNFKEFAKGKLIAKIFTDYFAGVGEQGADLFDNGKLIKKKDKINEVLKMMGVIRKEGEIDEFDTIGLGERRSNGEYIR